MADRICIVEGCDRPYSTKSGGDYCDAHYNRLRRHGDPLAGGTFRKRQSDDNPCTFEGCENRAKARGLCVGHYGQWKKGKPLTPLRQFNRVRDGRKRCPRCHEDLPLEAFGRKLNIQTWLCKPCTAIYHRARTYGVDFDEMKAMMESPCHGCGAVIDGRELHIDHCHDTGRVRGVLCNRCNHVLTEHTSPELLRRLADYLEN